MASGKHPVIQTTDEQLHDPDNAVCSADDLQPSTQQLNQLLAMQRSLLEKISLSLPIKQVLDQLCRSVEQIVGQCFVGVNLLNHQHYLSLSAAPTLSEHARSHFGQLLPGSYARSCGAAVFDDQPIFTANTRLDPRWRDHQALVDQFNIAACWSYPLHESRHKILGSISLFSNQPRLPSPFYARVLESAAHLAGIAIARHNSRMHLKDSEQRISHLAASIPGVVLQTEFTETGEPYFTFVSDGINELIGVTAEQALEDFSLFWQALDEQDRLNLRQMLCETEQDAQPVSRLECRLTHTQGERKWVYLTSTQERDSNNKLRRLNSIILDISREKAAYAQLELAGIAFAATSEGVMVADANNRIVDVNNAYCQMTGYSREELIGQPPPLLDPKRHDQQLYDNIYNTTREQGFWHGELWNRRKNGILFPQWLNLNAVYNQHGDLTHFVSVIADLSSLKASEEQLHHMRKYDALTDLPNRQSFKTLLDKSIEHARAQGDTPIAIMMIDLDRFKHVNETLGHQAGDQLLVQVTKRLRSSISADSLLARVGGDEFAVMLDNCSNQAGVEQMAKQIVQLLEQPFVLAGQNFFTTASIGISLFPRFGLDSETLIKNADTAVHQAKDRGRNNFAFYRPEQTQLIEQWVKREPELRRALELRQFCLFYQPQLDATTGRISGAEALLRWRHPVEGLILPEMFLPIMEEIGLMTRVGNWVLKQACQQAAAWQKSGYPEFRIAVNVAGSQLLSPDFAGVVEDALQDTGLPADLLELEIVENIVVQHADAARPVLERIRALGVRLALDDFGTGYSSLSYLKMLPIQKIKIDQSLVRDIPSDNNDEAITRAVIALSHSLNLTVCAEGVETLEQKVFLKREDCDQLQGYLINRPLPAHTFSLWLHQHKRLTDEDTL